MKHDGISTFVNITVAQLVFDDRGGAVDPGTNLTDWQNYAAMLVILVFMYFCCRRNPPDILTWRGHLIRRSAETVWHRREQLDRWRNPEVRQEAIAKALIKRQINSHDRETGHLTLGKVLEEGEVDNEDNCDIEAGTTVLGDSNGDEEAICAICLEPFRVGEVVAMRQQLAQPKENVEEIEEDSCHHVFHSECIESWLHSVHDDCPSCRMILLRVEDADNRTDPNIETVDISSADSVSLVIVNGLASQANSIASKNVTSPRSVLTLPPSMPLRKVLSYGDGRTQVVKQRAFKTPNANLSQALLLRRVLSHGESLKQSPPSEGKIPRRSSALPSSLRHRLRSDTITTVDSDLHPSPQLTDIDEPGKDNVFTRRPVAAVGPSDNNSLTSVKLYQPCWEYDLSPTTPAANVDTFSLVPSSTRPESWGHAVFGGRDECVDEEDNIDDEEDNFEEDIEDEEDNIIVEV